MTTNSATQPLLRRPTVCGALSALSGDPAAHAEQHPGPWGRIRTAYLADCPEAVPVVAAWLHRFWWAATGGSPEAALDRLGERANRDRLPLALVALADGEPVGTASVLEDTAPDDVELLPCLVSLFVLPQWRRRGVASVLCERAVQEAARLGLPKLHLYTAHQEAFFARRGWDKLVDTLVQVGSDYTVAAWMERPIPFT